MTTDTKKAACVTEDKYYFRFEMQEQCQKMKTKHLNFFVKTYGQSVQLSIQTNKLVVTEMKEPNKPTDEEWAAMSKWKQRKLDREMDNYDKYVRYVQIGLGKAYGILWDACHIGLKSKIKADPDFRKLNGGDAAGLFEVIGKICNGSLKGVAEDRMFAAVDTLYNFLYIKGEDYATLSEYTEGFDIRFKAMEKAGVQLVSA